MLPLVALILAATPPGDAAPVASDEEVAVDEDVADETVVRRRRPLPPRALQVPIRREGLAVGGASAATLLALVPGLFVSQHAGQGKAPQLFLRGFDVEHGQDLEVRVEGVPLNEPGNVHGHGYADTTFLPIEVVRRLRLDEGVADPGQGDFAVAGSVDHGLGLAAPGVVTRGSIGAFGLQRAFVGVRPDGGSEGTFVAAELVRSDGFGQGRAFSRVNLLGGLEAVVLPGLEAMVLVAASASSFGSAGVVRLDDRAVADLDDDALFAAAIPGQGGRAERHLGTLRLRHRADVSATTLQLSASRRRLGLRHNFTGRLQFDAGDTTAQTSDAATLVGRAEHELVLPLLDRRHRLRVGGEARGDVVHAHQQRLTDGGAVHREEVDARLQIGHAGLWLDSTLRPTPWLQLRLGARAEGVSSTTEDRLDDGGAATGVGAFLGPRLSAALRVFADTDVSASYGEGFRTPPPLALADGETPALTVVRTGEVGVQHSRQASTAALTLRGSAFVTHVASDRVFDHATATSRFVGPSLRTGLQGFVDVTVDDVGVTASATATDARFVAGGPVPLSPPVVLRVDAHVATPILRILGVAVDARAELGAGVIGARPLPFAETAEAITLVDGALLARAGVVQLALEAANLLDARVADGVFVYASRFADDDSRVPTRHITAASPRQLQLTLTLAL